MYTSRKIRQTFLLCRITLILKGNAKWDDISISPAIRQSLQHWAYKLTEADFKKDVLRREKQDKE